MQTIEINVVTYNRIEYLKKCIWSIIASTPQPYILRVLDDGLTDGTVEWLEIMEKRGLLEFWTNKEQKGPAENFNFLLDKAQQDFAVMSCDDMYFQRGWLSQATEALLSDKTGVLGMFDYEKAKQGTEFEKVWETNKIGLGCSWINLDVWRDIGKFHSYMLMGYWNTDYCNKVRKKGYRVLNLKNSPCINMDHPASRLCERDEQEEYLAHRKKHKQ